jgi:hypothetical protein
MAEDRFKAFERAYHNPELKAGVIGVAVVLIFLMIVGLSLTMKRAHPFEYGVVTFSGPMGLYASLSIVLDFLR